MNESPQSRKVFLNLKAAETLMEQANDPVVGAMLKLVYSQLTWDIANKEPLPCAPLDLGYIFTLLSKVLVRPKLEAVLANPAQPFPEDNTLW